MDRYVTGTVIKQIREKNNLTQSDLANKLSVSDKTISKWETGRGYPDITMIPALSEALGVSVIELFDGELVSNSNISANMQRSRFYVCPVCGNVMVSAGEAVISCCGITLPALEAEESDEIHMPSIEQVEDEWYVTFNHPMAKDHYISFVAGLNDKSVELVKLYPEGVAEARFKINKTRYLYWYCNKHGLFKLKIQRKK